MWNVTVFGESGWREARVVEVLGVPTIEALNQVSRQRLPNDAGLHRHLESELSSVVTADGLAEMHPNRRGFVARLRGQSGYVVGRLLRRLTFGTPTLDRDPLALHRERGASQRYSRVAQACPTLSEREVVVAREAMVFVH